jgi:hypothetical protein
MEVQLRLASESDIKAVECLQQETLANKVDVEEKEQEGFVSLITPLDILQRIRDEIGIVCAFNEQGNLIGYEIPLPFSIAKGMTFLGPFVDRVLELSYQNIPFTLENAVIEGQINIRKGFKGAGIAELLHKQFLALVGEKYRLVVTEVSNENPRSLNVHTRKLHMEIIKTFSAEGKEWYILAQKTY